MIYVSLNKYNSLWQIEKKIYQVCKSILLSSHSISTTKIENFTESSSQTKRKKRKKRTQSSSNNNNTISFDIGP